MSQATSVEDLQRHIESAEEAYEYLISYAGKGLDHHQPAGMSGEVRDFLEQFDAALAAAHAAAAAVPDEHEVAGETEYRAVLDRLADEIEEARTIIQLLAAQDVVTSAQVDSLNGMSVFQSVVMKLFFLDELTKPLVAVDG